MERKKEITGDDLRSMGYTAYMGPTFISGAYPSGGPSESPGLLDSLASAMNEGRKVVISRIDTAGTVRIYWEHNLPVEVYAIRRMSPVELLEADCDLANHGCSVVRNSSELGGEEKLVPVMLDSGSVADILRVHNYTPDFSTAFDKALIAWGDSEEEFDAFVYGKLRAAGYRFEVIKDFEEYNADV